MEKYGRVLIIIFFLCLINLALTFFVINKISIQSEPKPTTIAIVTKTSPTPFAKTTIVTDSTDIKSDLNTIKAEIRALREILETTFNTNEP
ncbi:MAG: hypothetical protein UR39_C0012G0007 [Candidatus Woesebacteria bacterium GW2011_GWA1_33_30]|uniref:Uncharacterized protein n=1 Tax=Candidatus Woesebacteria bacterium GW2011_GWA2_33_28 TaxID=1618561 RepID=A0A0G0C4X1_9BACT|nr:MAG: hypothetical protein UR38_C0012G0007 [Candidatus Woesebacteria bacterium GW2011_GWA2_33_28]KKP46926.1 MAG: hypothetical protein UR39_C0012G0007 [Candidatus Woesebacteria bacterium GW2011_GWA1_33_30]KKP48656.1 MAG: hypothetical protein UR40_C0013G0007 [Microgenomates group bacterium GW2011_GWC1_33_32]KKP51345.1 MAG: hypothetical protein UR44_C0012G0007 [Candidatus Woesebacteria bacterium GW2011_GWB1_33_38]